jgi:hypothetical protein
MSLLPSYSALKETFWYNTNMRISEKRKTILRIVGAALLAGTAILAPNTIQALGVFHRRDKYRNKQIVKKLFDDKIIYLSGEEITLTKKGLQLLKMIQVEDIQINKPDDDQEWYGIWHIICYDIPEKFKKERDHFKDKLKKSGFYKVQKSLWAYPYECKEEIAIISQNLSISPFVVYLNTDYLPIQSTLKKHFGLCDLNTEA